MPDAMELAGAPAKQKALLTRAWWAVVARFLVHGLVTATWVSRIPAIKEGLNLNNGALGLALLGGAVGSLSAIPVTGWLVGRYGSSRITNWSAVGFCLSLLFPGLAVNGVTLFLALFIYGAMAGANDVAMNAQAVAVENALGTPTMSRFHAMFSLGGMAGAAIGGIIAGRHIGAPAHLTGGALACLAITLGTVSLMYDFHNPQGAVAAHRLRLNAIPPVLLALCLIGFCLFLSEGAMADWAAIYLRQTLQSGPGTAAAGYAVFSAGMALFRLLGDAITVRLGPARTVRTCALVAAGGLAFALLVPSPYWALPGLFAAGAGFSSIVPLVFAAGGRIPRISSGAGVATVSGLGYLGFLFGPPAIGFLSQITSLRIALGVVVLLSLVPAALAGVMDRVDPIGIES